MTMKNRYFYSSQSTLSTKEYKRSRNESEYYEDTYELSKRQNLKVDDIDAVAEEMLQPVQGKMARAKVGSYGKKVYGKQYEPLPDIYSTPTKKFDCPYNNLSFDCSSQRSKYNTEKMIMSKYFFSSTSKVHPNPFEFDNLTKKAQPKIIYEEQLVGDGLVGLVNLGNTCFMNAILQCLLHSDKMIRFFNQPIDDINICKKTRLKGALAKSFARLFQDFYNQDSPTSFIAPTEVKKVVAKLEDTFDGFDQHDAHEFLRFLLDGLNDEVKSLWQGTQPISLSDTDVVKMSPRKQGEYYRSKHLFMSSSFITESFCGQFRSTVTCANCSHESYCFDPFYDLSLPLPNGSSGCVFQRKFRHSLTHYQDDVCTLNTCLESFFQGETLSNDAKMDCERCKKRQNCTRDLSIETAPQILVIHLKRFNNSRKKKSTVISFPLSDLDFSPYLSSNANQSMQVMYDLFAICHHSGTLNSGHYIASCLQKNTGEWYTFDDRVVSKVASNRPLSPCMSPYILFYRKR